VDGKAHGSNAVFLGDRVTPGTITVDHDSLVVSFLDRRIDEPMTVAPSVMVSHRLTIKDGNLVTGTR
jgi:hypothetical protein